MSWSNRLALAILILFMGLGVFYGAVNPLFESPDELMHYPYVQYLASGHGLPVQQPGSDALWEQEGSQPPLYYALSAALTFWIDTSDLPQVRVLNPHARVGVPLAPDNKNVLIHTAREDFPWRGTVLAVHLLRLFSLILGTGTVWCTYLLARRIVPNRPEIALGAMAVNAFLPMFVFISSSVNNDNLIVFLSSVTLLLLVRLVQSCKRGGDVAQLLLLGLVIGLACLSKLSGLALVPLAALALALRRWVALHPQTPHSASPVERGGGAGPHPGPLPEGEGAITLARRQEEPTVGRGVRGLSLQWVSLWREAWGWARDMALVLLPVLAVAGWWYVRNWNLYGDPLGTGPMVAIMGRRTDTPTLTQLLGEFRGFRMSFWGIFGWFNVLMRPQGLYRLLDVLTVAAILGLVVALFKGGRASLWRSWPVYVLLLAWLAALSISLVRWTMTTRASQGRLIFPAISVLSLLLVLGLAGWLSAARSRRVLLGVGAGLFVLAVASPLAFIRPAYARPAVLTPQDVPSTAQPFLVDYGGAIRLLAFDLDRNAVQPGESLGVTLYWEALRPMDKNYSVYLHLFGWREQAIGQSDSYPGGGNYPTSQWVPGQVIRDRMEVTVDDDEQWPMAARTPVAARVQVGVYDLQSMENLQAVDAQGQPVGRAILGLVKVTVPTQPVQPDQVVVANLDNRVRLLGYKLDEGALRPGATVPMTLYWQVTGTLPRDYSVFIHLVDEDGNMAGQGDGPPMEGYYPTSFWEQGETLADLHSLVVADTAKPGTHHLQIGLYDLETGQRLALLDSSGVPIGDTIDLGAVQLQPPLATAPADDCG